MQWKHEGACSSDKALPRLCQPFAHSLSPVFLFPFHCDCNSYQLLRKDPIAVTSVHSPSFCFRRTNAKQIQSRRSCIDDDDNDRRQPWQPSMLRGFLSLSFSFCQHLLLILFCQFPPTLFVSCSRERQRERQRQRERERDKKGSGLRWRESVSVRKTETNTGSQRMERVSRRERERQGDHQK